MQQLDEDPTRHRQTDSRGAARSAVGARRHRRPKRDQPGQGILGRGRLHGIVLAKLDGTAKGGVVIPIRQQFELPVKYIGLGETAEDLALFDVDRFVEALF